FHHLKLQTSCVLRLGTGSSSRFPRRLKAGYRSLLQKELRGGATGYPGSATVGWWAAWKLPGPSLALNQQAQRRERPDLHELVLCKALCDERQRFDCRLGLLDRVDIHDEDHAGFVLAVKELFDLSVEIELERRRDFLRHDLRPLLRRDRLDD